jgi:hypothetical protein
VHLLKDRLGNQRGGGSEWAPLKILLRRVDLDYVPNSQPRIPTQACQGRIVTTDLPTLGTSLKQITSESATQEEKDIGKLQCSGQTVHEGWEDPVRKKLPRTTNMYRRKTDGLYPTRGRYADNATCADSLASPSGQSDKHLATKPLTLCDRNVKCS